MVRNGLRRSLHQAVQDRELVGRKYFAFVNIVIKLKWKGTDGLTFAVGNLGSLNSVEYQEQNILMF